jgi:hypothetical protein
MFSKNIASRVRVAGLQNHKAGKTWKTGNYWVHLVLHIPPIWNFPSKFGPILDFCQSDYKLPINQYFQNCNWRCLIGNSKLV